VLRDGNQKVEGETWNLNLESFAGDTITLMREEKSTECEAQHVRSSRPPETCRKEVYGVLNGISLCRQHYKMGRESLRNGSNIGMRKFFSY